MCGRPKHTLKHLQDPAAVAASKAEVAVAGEKGASGTGALRTAFPGRDASGDQSVSVPDLASAGQTTDAARASGPIGASRCLAASRSWDAGGSSSCAPRQDTAGFVRYLELLEAHHQAVQREIYLVLDNGSAHTSQEASRRSPLGRTGSRCIWLAK